MQEATIVVLAAGMGSRYGGIKQMATVGPNGEWLLDYSLYDAWRAGFRRVIFIIRPELEASFDAAIGQRISAYFKIDYAYQTNSELVPESLNLSDRRKPLGTGHALLCARHLIEGPFAIINADDYYGPIAYQLLFNKLNKLNSESSGALVAYKLKDTLSAYGMVARGLCDIDEKHNLLNVSEKTGLHRADTNILDENGVVVGEDTWVSMNIWGLPKAFLGYLEMQFSEFVKYELRYNPKTAEFYLPQSVNSAIAGQVLNIETYFSSDTWTGMTYVEDYPKTKQLLETLQTNKIYPERLWTPSTEFTEIMRAFGYSHTKHVEPITRGHINATYLVTEDSNRHIQRLILQKINTHVFQHPEQLMANIEAVTQHVKSQELVTLELLSKFNGEPYHTDASGHCWRLYRYIEDSQVPNEQASLNELSAAGYAFGRFQQALNGFDASVLYEVIPDFHHTPKRYQQLLQAIALNPLDRCGSAAEAIGFVETMASNLDYIISGLASGRLPLRVTHNDTKVNNVLLSNKTGEGLCVIDLDTVMPGSVLYDYGDGIRSTVTGKSEDTLDLNAIGVDLERFKAFTEGFLQGASNMLTDSEVDGLVNGAILMTLECGMRFLTDYLLGDVYFKIDYPDQNLVRTKSQFQLVKALLEEQRTLEAIIKSLYYGGK